MKNSAPRSYQALAIVVKKKYNLNIKTDLIFYKKCIRNCISLFFFINFASYLNSITRK